MKQQMYVLPVRCERCKTVFDLWYDLEEQQSEGEILLPDLNKLDKLVRQSLCWRCRGALLNELSLAKEDYNEVETNFDDYEILYE
ncbi:MAG: hypothetical protein AABX73_01155 [Nanoarchaeota archaeon]